MMESRKNINEYLQFLDFALGSAGESVSGWHALHAANQISIAQFEKVDAVIYKLVNGLIRLVQSLQVKRETNEWSNTLLLRESNTAYEATKSL